jgi:hypothetical protein
MFPVEIDPKRVVVMYSNYHNTDYNLNRCGIPQTLKDYQLRNRGDIFVMNNGPLECYKYLDSKHVYMLSTKHGSSLSTTSRRNRITNEIIRKPNVVTNYNKYMGGVDRSDQMISYTINVVKSFKWWKKVFFHVLAITVLHCTLYTVLQCLFSSLYPLI